VRYPHTDALVYFVIPMKIRTVATIFAIWYILNLLIVSRLQEGTNAGGDACHLAGLVVGVGYEMVARFRNRRSVRAFGGARNLARVFSGWFGRRRSRPRPGPATVDEEEVDRILRKVYDSGVHSLTETERQTLLTATERKRRSDN
jgi:hypothetical protein